MKKSALQPDEMPRSFDELASSGLLWLINKSVLWPRGFALALFTEPVDDGIDAHGTLGWNIVGDGSSPIQGTPEVEELRFAAIETLLNSKRAAA